VTWLDLLGAGVTAAPSPVESDRFGMSMARVVVGQEAVWDDALHDDLVVACARDEDVLVVRWPSRLVECGAVLATSGRDVVPADTLVYWEAPSAMLAESGQEPADAPQVRRGVAAPPDLDDLVERVFAGYINHYTANPLLGRDLVLEGYVDWVRRTVRRDPGTLAVLVQHEQSVGVATWFVDPAGDFVEILLAGLVPEARRRGWYALLLAEVGRAAAGVGSARVVISTQGSNVSVQRAWVRAGFVPFASVTTAHAVRRGLLPDPLP
jgi:GNAT superfamily N-acetyltransferase